ncbi:FtsX-like permease family protein [Crocinitomicaceae bacterium]|nr:FtsX-like permease family protein [Crocinitomicaceae bacterium]
MAFEYFISRRTLKSVVQGKKVSRPIVRISIYSIALAVIVNLMTLAVVTGFQQEVRQKVQGFGSHIFIMTASDYSIFESDPIRKDQAFVEEIANTEGVKSIHAVGYKPVLFQSKKEEISYKLPNGKDTSETQQNVFATVIKGVEDSYDWSFFKQHLIDGEIPKFGDSLSNKALISKKLANDLHFETGDTVGAFFVRNMPIKQNFIISGIYETGLEEFDKKFVLGDLRYVQVLNDWGIHSLIEVEDTLRTDYPYEDYPDIPRDRLVFTANVTGGNGYHRFDWGRGFNRYNQIPICPTNDTIIQLVGSDHLGDVFAPIETTTLPDTAYIKIEVEGEPYAPCNCATDETGELIREFDPETGKFSVTAPYKRITFQIIPGKGSSEHYVGGFEVNVKNWDRLDELHEKIDQQVAFIPSPYNEQLKVTSIKENENDIFVWLGFLDINVVIILVLMIIIGIINMGSALLVLILIRSNFIGILKSIGATNWKIQKIFLIQASFLIGRGMLIGNIIGLGLCFAQKWYGIIPLDPKVYYLNQVPIELNVWHWLFLNIGTLLVCVLALMIPSRVISRISPVKAIKFN